MSDNQSSRIYGIIVTFLLLFSSGIGWFFWEKSKNILTEIEQKDMMFDSLATLKVTIERDLDSMQLSYTSLRTENETLQGRLTETAAIVAEKESIIKQIRATTTNDLAVLQAQIESLQKAKADLETIITTIQNENAVLKNENVALKGDIASLQGDKQQLQGQVNDLSEKLAEQIRKTQSALFRASSFRVEIARRNEKLTSRARRAREVTVSFDLIDVPEAYHGAQKLYLAITDENGKPIICSAPIMVKIMAPSGPVDITAQMIKQISMVKTQRHSFTYGLEERLKAGNYVAAIYCEKGLLGAASFRLS